MQTRRLLVAALACGSLTFSACGGDDAGEVLAPVTAPPADAAARAESALLTLDDVPAGYTVATPEPDEEEESSSTPGGLFGDAREPDECEDIDGDSGDDDAASAEIEFAFETDTSSFEISHEMIYAGEAEALAAVAALKHPDVAECLRAYMQMGAEEEAAADDTIVVEEVTLTRDALDQPADLATFSGRMVMAVPEIPGFSMEATVHFEFRAVGPFFSSLSFFALEGEPVDFADLNAKIDQRVAAALA
jgi:hypothetical protein